MHRLLKGKKSFGKAAADVLTVSVDFAENIAQIAISSRVPVQQQMGVSLVGSTTTGSETVLSKVLFEQHGLQLLKHVLELAQVLAESSGSSSASANVQAMTTHRLIGFIISGLNDERVCAELLHAVRYHFQLHELLFIAYQFSYHLNRTSTLYGALGIERFMIFISFFGFRLWPLE